MLLSSNASWPIDWMFRTEVQEHAGLAMGGVSSWPRGKVLGGTSILNYMLYVRGNKVEKSLLINLVFATLNFVNLLIFCLTAADHLQKFWIVGKVGFIGHICHEFLFRVITSIFVMLLQKQEPQT